MPRLAEVSNSRGICALSFPDYRGGEEAKGRHIKTVASLLGGRTALLGGVALVHSAQTAFIFSAGILPDKNSSLYN